MGKKNSIYREMDNDFLSNFIPDVYQENIYKIDYKKLIEKGITLITFDVDDTIIPKKSPILPKAAIIKVTELKKMGFEVMLLSNAKDPRVQKLAEQMDVKYVAKAKKPSIKHFEEIRDSYNLKESQMAHVGNSIMNDVGGGNSFGITTCLVRPVAHEKEIAPELAARGLWRKHHKSSKGDQYYQLGEKQRA